MKQPVCHVTLRLLSVISEAVDSQQVPCATRIVRPHGVSLSGARWGVGKIGRCSMGMAYDLPTVGYFFNGKCRYKVGPYQL